MSEELVPVNKQIDITEVNGRTSIIFKKALIKGKVSSSEVLNTILIAAKMQAEYYIQKLSRGSPLDNTEVKALKELSEITKLEVAQPENKKVEESVQIEQIKTQLYLKLTEKLEKS